MASKKLAEFKAKFGFTYHIKLIPAEEDEVHIHCPWYWALYAYPFLIGYSFPLLLLVEEFCRHYSICPAKLTQYVYKVTKMLTKFIELVGVELTLQNLVHLFAPRFYKGTMLNLHHRGGKWLIVKMDDKSSWKFWVDFFYVRTEDIMTSMASFRLGTIHISVQFFPFSSFIFLCLFWANWMIFLFYSWQPTSSPRNAHFHMSQANSPSCHKDPHLSEHF